VGCTNARQAGIAAVLYKAAFCSGELHKKIFIHMYEYIFTNYIYIHI